jgi:hypothetical protein
MTPDVPNVVEPMRLISARDAELGARFPAGFLDRYEIHSYRNAARILATASPDEFAELVNTLMSFSIATIDMVRGGGNKSQIALKMDALLNPLGWYETRIRGDMLIQTITVEPNPRFVTLKKERRPPRSIVLSGSITSSMATKSTS